MSSVRGRRTTSGTTLLALLISTACTTPHSNAPANRPTPAGDAVTILAGNGAFGKTKPNAFSTKTPLTKPSAMAVSANDGALLVATDNEGQGEIARIGTDGRVSTISNDLSGAVRAMEVRNGDVWSLWPTPAPSSASYSALYRQALSGGKSVEFFGGYGTKTALTQVDGNGKRLPETSQRKLSRAWYPMGLYVRATGEPIVALEDGRLFDALGGSKVRQFIPEGYERALNTVGGKNFSVMAVTDDPNGGFVILGPTGAIWVSSSGKAEGVRFITEIPPGIYKGWYKEWGAAAFGNGDLLIAAEGHLYLVGRNGSVRRILTGKTVTCKAADRLSDFGIPARTRLVRLSDESVAMSTFDQCNRVYTFKPPHS
jgi:hypothetical protein